MNGWCNKDQHIKEEFHMDGELTREGGSMKLEDEKFSELCAPLTNQKMLTGWQMVSNEHMEASQRLQVPNAIKLKGRGIFKWMEE